MKETYFYDFLLQWKMLPFEDGLPSIKHLDKMDLSTIGHNMFVLERWVDDYMPVTQFGGRLKRIYGQNMRGLNFLGLFTGRDRAVVSHNINTMIDYKCGGLVGWLGIKPGGEYMEIRNYGLPFMSEDGETPQIVGFTEVVNVENQAMLAPGRISVWPVKRSKLFDLGNGVPAFAQFEDKKYARLV